MNNLQEIDLNLYIFPDYFQSEEISSVITEKNKQLELEEKNKQFELEEKKKQQELEKLQILHETQIQLQQEENQTSSAQKFQQNSFHSHTQNEEKNSKKFKKKNYVDQQNINDKTLDQQIQDCKQKIVYAKKDAFFSKINARSQSAESQLKKNLTNKKNSQSIQHSQESDVDDMNQKEPLNSQQIKQLQNSLDEQAVQKYEDQLSLTNQEKHDYRCIQEEKNQRGQVFAQMRSPKKVAKEKTLNLKKLQAKQNPSENIQKQNAGFIQKNGNKRLKKQKEKTKIMNERQANKLDSQNSENQQINEPNSQIAQNIQPKSKQKQQVQIKIEQIENKYTLALQEDLFEIFDDYLKQKDQRKGNKQSKDDFFGEEKQNKINNIIFQIVIDLEGKNQENGNQKQQLQVLDLVKDQDLKLDDKKNINNLIKEKQENFNKQLKILNKLYKNKQFEYINNPLTDQYKEFSKNYSACFYFFSALKDENDLRALINCEQILYYIKTYFLIAQKNQLDKTQDKSQEQIYNLLELLIDCLQEVNKKLRNKISSKISRLKNKSKSQQLQQEKQKSQQENKQLQQQNEQLKKVNNGLNADISQFLQRNIEEIKQKYSTVNDYQERQDLIKKDTDIFMQSAPEFQNYLHLLESQESQKSNQAPPQ